MSTEPDVFRADLRRYVDRARIDCERLFEFVCPLYWGDLDATPDPTVRHCRECERSVHLVTSEADFSSRAARGECVAVVLPEELVGPVRYVEAERARAERERQRASELPGRSRLVTMGQLRLVPGFDGDDGAL